MVTADIFNGIAFWAEHPPHNWRTLFSGSSEVGVFRLKHETDYLNREMEFRPMVPLSLDQSKLGEYLERELEDFRVEINEEGAVSVRLGPHQMLGPVASRVAFTFKQLLKEKRETNKNGDQKQRA